MNRRSRRGALAAALAVCCGLGADPAVGGDAKAKNGKADARRSVGQVTSPPGSLLRCTDAKDCRVLKDRATVFGGDQLLALPGLRGDVELHQGAVRLSLVGSLPKEEKQQVFESAITLHTSPQAALDFTLQRGRVLVTSLARGGAKVRVHLPETLVSLELAEPGAAVALELVRHWPPGQTFTREDKQERRPVADAFLFVLKGSVNVRLADGTEQNGLGAGALYHWNGLRGVVGPVRVKELPAWTRAPSGPEKDKALSRFRRRLASKGLPEALRERDALAVYALAAVGDLPAVLGALADPKAADVRRAAVTALRHWIARGTAAEKRLYDALVASGYRPAQAETAVRLLHPFTPADVQRRETYDTLIDYLTSDRPAVRELAAWHLYRLVPEARSIPYDAVGPQAERARAQGAWRKLLRAGKLPPAGSAK